MPFVVDIKEKLELLGVVLGILTSIFAGIRAILSTISNHTLSRKRRKASEDVNTYLELLRNLENTNGGHRTIDNLSVYQDELMHNLTTSLATLQSARQEVARRLEPKKGWEKAFVLYTPLNLDGLLTQSCFLGLLAAPVVVGFQWIRQAASLGDIAGTAIVVLVIGPYLSQSADQIHRVSVYEQQRHKMLPDHLSTVQRNFLLFHLGDAWLYRLFYYVAGLLFFFIIIVFALIVPNVTRWDLIKLVTFLVPTVIVMRVSRASALAIRKLDILGQMTP